MWRGHRPACLALVTRRQRALLAGPSDAAEERRDVGAARGRGAATQPRGQPGDSSSAHLPPESQTDCHARIPATHPTAQHEVPVTVAMAVLTVPRPIDAISFLAFGQVFTAVATGNLLFRVRPGGQGSVPVERPAIALAAFIVGVDLRLRPDQGIGDTAGSRPRWVSVSARAVAGLVALGVAGIGATMSRIRCIVLVALAMGLRSAAALRAAIPGMPDENDPSSLVTVIDTFIARRGRAGRPAKPEGAKLSLIRHAATIGGTVVAPCSARCWSMRGRHCPACGCCRRARHRGGVRLVPATGLRPCPLRRDTPPDAGS